MVKQDKWSWSLRDRQSKQTQKINENTGDFSQRLDELSATKVKVLSRIFDTPKHSFDYMFLNLNLNVVEICF